MAPSCGSLGLCKLPPKPKRQFDWFSHFCRAGVVSNTQRHKPRTARCLQKNNRPHLCHCDACDDAMRSIHILLYGLEACPLLKSDLSLDFVVNRLFVKLFKTSNIDAKCCQDHFGYDLPSVSWSKRVKKFAAKFHVCNNLLCKITYR